MHTAANKKYQSNRGQDRWLFRVLISLAFVWFFAKAIVSKFTHGWVDGCDSRESCVRAALRNAYSTVPYVFMRV